MEKSEKVDSTKETEQVKRNGTWGGSCPWWIFGDKDSADKDLKEKFEIVDDEKKD